MPLSNFALNMNVVFARFLARRLAANAPADIHLVAQDVRSDVFSYLENAGGRLENGRRFGSILCSDRIVDLSLLPMPSTRIATSLRRHRGSSTS